MKELHVYVVIILTYKFINNQRIMVQIRVMKFPQLQDWTMVEFQGELINRDGGTHCGKTIGDLHFTKKGEPIMIIGHHIMTGKVVSLDKPFAVLHKEKKTLCENEELKMDPNAENTFLVKALIRTKIIFSSRPKPIIIHVPSAR